MIESVVLPAVGNMVTNVIQNSVSGFVEAGTRTIGGYAGDFIIRGGDIIENAGRGVGENIALRGEAWGQSIKGYYGPQNKVRPLPIRSKSTSFLTSSSAIVPRAASTAVGSIASIPKKGLPPAPKKPTTTGTTATTTHARSAASTAPIRARPAVKSATTGAIGGGAKPASASKSTKPSTATASKANVPIVATTAINPASKRSTASSAPIKKVVAEKRSLPQSKKPAAPINNNSNNKNQAKPYSHIPLGGIPTGSSSNGAAKKPTTTSASSVKGSTGASKAGSAPSKTFSHVPIPGGIGGGNGSSSNGKTSAKPAASKTANANGGGSKKKDDVLAPKKYDFF